MPDFEEVGFLCDELSQFRENVRAKHAVDFLLMERANALAMRIMWTLPRETLDETIVYAIMCYARAVQNFQGVILMSERGAITEARVLLRALAETVILALGLFEKADMLALLQEDAAAHRKGIANSIIEMNNNSRTGADTSSFRQVVKDVKVQYGDKPRSIKWASLAYEVGVGEIYEAAYRFTSGDAAHATMDSLNRHLQFQAVGDLHQFVFKPTDDDLPQTFRAGLASIVKLMELAVTKLGASQFDQDLQKLNLALSLYFKAI